MWCLVRLNAAVEADREQEQAARAHAAAQDVVASAEAAAASPEAAHTRAPAQEPVVVAHRFVCSRPLRVYLSMSLLQSDLSPVTSMYAPAGSQGLPAPRPVLARGRKQGGG